MIIQTLASLFQYINIDQIIVLLFLLATLIIGMVAGKDIKDITDYSIANKSYGTPVLVLTLMATMIGGGSTTGSTAQTFTEGIIYPLVSDIGGFIGIIILGRFIVSKFDQRFEGMLSVSDMIKYFYGTAAEKFSGILGYISSVGVFAAQLIAMGHLISNFLGISYINAVMITSSLVITYSIAGGIRAVAITDVFQFAVLIVIVPIIANVVTVEAGGLSQIFDQNSVANHLQIQSHPKLLEYSSYFIALCLPFGLISPSLVQRYLMTKSSNQASQITYILACLSVALGFMTTCMAFSALHLFPEIEPKLIIPTIIDKLLPVGFKGLAIAGMLAVIMSTADSELNSGGILIAHNVFPENAFKSAKAKLNFMKICTLISGVVAVIIAAQNYNITLTIVITGTLYISISLPIIMGLLRFKVNKHCFWVCTFANVLTFAIASVYKLPGFALPLICIAVSLLSFVVTCYMTNKGILFIESKNKMIYTKKKKLFAKKTGLSIFQKLVDYSTRKVNKVGANHLVFGIFCCINYVVPFFMWTVEKPVHYPVMLSLRIIAGFLCVGLLLKDYWPEFLKKYFPVYWHFTLMFCLPFVTTVMFILMNANIEWMINLALAIMLLTMLVDWVSFILIAFFGVITGYMFYKISIGAPSLNIGYYNMYLLTYVSIFSTMIGIIFARKKEVTAEEKLETMQLLGGGMAHELRSPLCSIISGLKFVDDVMNKAESKTSDEKTILFFDTQSYKLLSDALKSLKTLSNNGIKTVDHILTSIKNKVVAEDIGIYNLSKCLREVISTDCTEKEQKQIILDVYEKATFYGSRKYVKHVFINLINNAFKYGGADVQIEIKLKGNQLVFRDNGQGIAPTVLPKIFNRFYTSSSTGTGIGLSFCKMVMEDLGGTISCKSELGKYTEFVLTFPHDTKN